MSTIRRKIQWLKEMITIEEGKKILKQYNNNYRWPSVSYLHTPKHAPKFNEWGNLIKKFKSVVETIQELIIKKLHGGTKVRCIQHTT
jgi:hypothetical protein